MNGPGRGGRTDDLDDALALANGAPTAAHGGACADCPARAPGGRRAGEGDGSAGLPAPVTPASTAPAASAPASAPASASASGESPPPDAPCPVSAEDDVTPNATTDVARAASGARPDASPTSTVPEPVEDLAAPWLSAASAAAEGRRPSPATAATPAPEDDLAPPWLLRPDQQVDAGEPAGAAGRLSEAMRTWRRPAPAETGGDGESPRPVGRDGGDAGPEAEPEDGLLPEWLTGVARRVGLDPARTDGPAPSDGPARTADHPRAPEEGADGHDELAAPWVPRVRPTSPPPATPPTDVGPTHRPTPGPTHAPAPARPPGASPPPLPGPGSGQAGGPGCARVGEARAAHTREEALVADSPHPPADAGPPPPSPAHADVPWDVAQRVAARAAEPGASVTVPLDRAVRQVLAAPVDALADLPSFDTSAMDGWAVAGPGPWTPVGPPETRGVLAGGEAAEPLADGCAVRIATGARIPAGATAVLRSERAALHEGRLRLAAGAPPGSTDPGTDIRPRGQECRVGDRLLPAGTPVTPPVLGLAAAAGYDRLTVTPRPRAEVLVLGDELLHEGLPSDGLVRDALGPMVGPWLSALGAEVMVTRRLGDDADALHEAITTTTADLVVTTGGTAHGPVDHVRPTLHRIGARLLVDGVEVRPGHPMLMAALTGAQQRRHLVGLPGNPLAAVSGLLTLAAPLLRARAGLPEPEPVRAALTADVPGHPRDTRLVPVARTADGAGATPLRWTGPAMLRGIAGASALAAVPPGGATAGMSVRLLELPW